MRVTNAGVGVLLLVGLVSAISAQSRVRVPVASPSSSTHRSTASPVHPRPRNGSAASPLQAGSAQRIFEAYCVDCHGKGRPKGGVSVARLIEAMTPEGVGEHWEHWQSIAEMIETRQMPPEDADTFPSDAERRDAVTWIRASLDAYDARHAGEPGRVTMRRLTSAEYAYAIADLTGVAIRTGVDASSDAVGGEGFANFGDVQFMQDATVERYLEAARRVADHAVIGSGPLGFFADPGRTGMELSALHRIEQLYGARGFRVVSGEGGRPFGFDRYAKAMYVAWHYRHRRALGEPSVTLRALAGREGITGRFAEHVRAVMNRKAAAYPINETIDRWRALPAPGADAAATVARVRQECDAITKALVSWPSWFFARGDLAAGGRGDENPLVFDDTTLGVVTAQVYRHALNRRPGRPASRLPAPWTVHLSVDALHTGTTGTPAVIWRNPRVVLREAPPPALAGAEPAAVARRRVPGPIVATHALRSVLSAEQADRLQFGRSADGALLSADDFATTRGTSIVIDMPVGEHVAELHVEAELGRDRDAVLRVMGADTAGGPALAPGQRVFLGDQASRGYAAFRAGIAELVALLPPNSHGAANPADKDPVPRPFDNTYNSPEHDAFVTQVKYQRSDEFFTANIVEGEERARLEHAWNDLHGSWPYHDAYLGMLLDHYEVTDGSRKIEDMTPARIASLPTLARPHVRTLRAHYDAVTAAMRRAEPGHLDDAIAFASRAWRRPVTPAEEARLREFYRTSRRERSLDHEAAVRALLARVLMSPAFLYRVEAAPALTETALTGWEMASRLSFFLWSSIPDEELRRAAAAGELRTAKGLAAQVRRMTADPKARRLSTEFFGQWLGFYGFDTYGGVDTGRFPEFTNEVRAAMYEEAVATFEYLVRRDRPVREILHGDYAFLNAPLARFYGLDMPSVTSDAVERVEGAGAMGRGGALRLGAVLTTTSAPLRTSPVKRGDWILRRILGTPTPPPPADAGTLPADDKSFEGQTLRQRLAQHKQRPQCASCHWRIDPLGFPLEEFDAVGRGRTAYADGNAVDIAGEFRDGTTINGSEALLQHLRTKEPQVLTTLARKMIGYALGRNPQASDRRLIADMVRQGGDASFADLAVRIVTSRQFRHRVGTATAPSTPAAPSTPGPITSTSARATLP